MIEPEPQPTNDQDSAWKEMLNEYFPSFVEFFFPHIYPEIDWPRGYESLDTELARIRPAHDAGKLLADKLFKVWLINGKAAWLLIHVEVQDRVTKVFARRLFIYNYRLLDKEKHQVEVVSLAVLTGLGRAKTGHYATERWGCKTVFEFPCARVADYVERWNELEASDNVFAVVVMAQLKAHETRGDNDLRLRWKRHLIFSLYRRGFAREQIINLFRFIEWVMTLPAKLEQQLEQEVYEYEESNKMPYLARFERVALQQGLEEGLERMRGLTLKQLEAKVGTLADRVQRQLNKLSTEQVEQLGVALLNFHSKADLTDWLKAHQPQNGHTRKAASRAATH
ncbi:MAG: DUF4351 domain-containing protein [Acidobacteria bacterium]|nr:DUF4351 domain-containing protein [Acidobacteriota bacterium]